jgi:D-3-phosphoglycerate dehydrogenase
MSKLIIWLKKSLLQLLKPQSVIINTSRGGIIDSDDLLWALQNHKIAGAALDVVENEYKISQNELIKWSNEHNNLIITPHIGGKTFESTAKTELFLAEKLFDLIKDENSGDNSGT